MFNVQIFVGGVSPIPMKATSRVATSDGSGRKEANVFLCKRCMSERLITSHKNVLIS